VAHVDNLDKDIGGLFLLILHNDIYVGNFRNKIHPTAIKINDISLECPHRTPSWLEASHFLDCPHWIPRWHHVEALKGASNS
jgi:hypothetical protein